MLRKSISQLSLWTWGQTPLRFTARYQNPGIIRIGARKGHDSEVGKVVRKRIKGEILYGFHPVLAALLNAKRTCHKIFINEKLWTKLPGSISRIIELAEEKSVELVPVDNEVLDYACNKRPHQGICMDVSKMVIESLDLDKLTKNDPHLMVYLHQINDPMNMGAVMRSSAYFGIQQIILSKFGSCRLSPVVSRASAGAMETLNINHISKPDETLQELKQSGYSLLGTGLGENCTELENYLSRRRVVLLLGNEGHGLPDSLVSLCDDVVTITRRGQSPGLDSLNVGVAAGILLHRLSAR